MSFAASIAAGARAVGRAIAAPFARRSPVEPPAAAHVGPPMREQVYRPPGAWTMDQVEAALEQHERGDFRESGRLCDALLCDEEILSLLGLRVGSVTGLPFHFDPAPVGIEADFEHMLPHAAQDDILQKALLMGFAWVQDNRTSYDELPQWIPWTSDGCRYDLYRRQWQVYTQDRGLVDVEAGDGQWARFDSRMVRPWMAGYVRAIAPMMIIRQSTLYNWANHAQVYATPSRILMAPARMGEMEDVQRAIARLKHLVGDSTIVLPEGLTMELLELKELTYQIYERLRKAIDEALQILLVGNLGTAKASGGYGSAPIERRVTQQLLERDCKILAPTVWRQIIAPYDAWKRGTRDLLRVPRPIWDATPPADKQAMAQQANMEADAAYKRALELKTLAALDFGGGWRVDMQQVCKERGLPLRQLAPAERPALPPAAPAPKETLDAAA